MKDTIQYIIEDSFVTNFPRPSKHYLEIMLCFAAVITARAWKRLLGRMPKDRSGKYVINEKKEKYCIKSEIFESKIESGQFACKIL